MNFVRFKTLKHESNLQSIAINNGSIYFAQDTNRIFADYNGVRKQYSLASSDITANVGATVDSMLADVKTELDSIEASLDDNVENNYRELKENLKEIGQYSTTAEVQQMIAGTHDVVTKNYGTVENGVIKLDAEHSIYKINTQQRTQYDVDVTALNSSNKVISFEILVENANVTVPNFVFQPTTLDISQSSIYNNKYTLLKIIGFRESNNIMWTLKYEGGWNS